MTASFVQVAFVQVARGFIASRGASGTRGLYTSDLDRWVAYCEDHGVDITKPAPAQAAGFRDALKATQKPLTVRRTLSALSRIYRAALNHHPRAAEWNPFDPDALARPPASDFSKTEVLSEEEIAAIMRVAESDAQHGLRDVAILRLLYDSGLRISAVCTLLREKVLSRPGGGALRVSTKNKDEVDVELTTESAEALNRWLSAAPPSKYVFPSSRDRKMPVSRRVIWKRLKDYGTAAGVPNIHPHRFRATYITEALDAGIPLHEVQAAVHHATPAMTLRYDRGVRGRGVAETLAKFRNKRK